MTNLESILKSFNYFANKDPSSQGYGFSSSHVWMWELDCEESWAPKNLCFWTVVLEKTLVSPLDCKEIQPVHPKGDQSWVFIGRTDAEAETTILWPPHVKSWLIGKDCYWEGLGAGGEGDNRGWDVWMATPTWCTWVWVNSGSWCWTGSPGVLWFMGSQRVGHDWATELNISCFKIKLHIPGLGRSPWEGKGYPLQYSGLENIMDCLVHRVTKSQAWLSDFHFYFTYIHSGLPRLLIGKESTCQIGDTSSIPGSGQSPREGNGNPL